VLTGDYVNDSRTLPERAEDMAACAREVARLRAPLGVFAIFGNHDFPPPPADPPLGPWRNAGVTPLLDEAAPLTIRGARLFLIGLRSSLVRPIRPEQVLDALPRDARTARLLLWHEPDRADESARAGAGAQLSGHTHGGQVVLPGTGPLVLPPQGQKFPAGRYDVEGMPLYVTRGVGMLPPRVRFCCPPEVTVLRLWRGGR